MDQSLASKKCVACTPGMPPLPNAEAEVLLRQINDWSMTPDGKSIHRDFKTKNFARSLELANTIGSIAEAEGHHPDLFVAWGKLGVTLTTHAINGLSENDFVMAAKIDIACRTV